jgi:DNA adenine methylase
MIQPLKIHGGKHYLASWVISHFPPHTHYLEPFFGGGSVLLAKDPVGTSETVNDMNAHLINFWRVLRDPCLFNQLAMQATLTPFSEYEFWDAHSQLTSTNPVIRACGFLVRNRQSRQGLERDYATPSRRTRRGMHEGVAAWLSAVDGLPEVHERIRRVEIRQMPAVEFIERYDHEDALFYCDPPYLPETRTVKDAYKHEMNADDHAVLLDALAAIRGKFVLSGYPSELYAKYEKHCGWSRAEKFIDNKAGSGDSKRTMTECLWMNTRPR